MTDPNLLAVRAAVQQAIPIAEVFHTATATFYDPASATPAVPVLVCTCRVKKPKPSAFDASNQTAWSTKRVGQIKVPMTFGVVDSVDYSSVITIEKGWVVQISANDSAHVDGDPTLYDISLTVQSALTGQFAAERVVTVASETEPTPRIS